MMLNDYNQHSVSLMSTPRIGWTMRCVFVLTHRQHVICDLIFLETKICYSTHRSIVMEFARFPQVFFFVCFFFNLYLLHRFKYLYTTVTVVYEWHFVSLHWKPQHVYGWISIRWISRPNNVWYTWKHFRTLSTQKQMIMTSRLRMTARLYIPDL